MAGLVRASTTLATGVMLIDIPAITTIGIHLISAPHLGAIEAETTAAGSRSRQAHSRQLKVLEDVGFGQAPLLRRLFSNSRGQSVTDTRSGRARVTLEIGKKLGDLICVSYWPLRSSSRPRLVWVAVFTISRLSPCNRWRIRH